MKKAIALALTLALSLGMLAGCGGGSKEPEYSGPSYAELKVGEDYTDLKAELRVITHRTDLIQEDPEKRDFTNFVKEFNALYPNITINYEGITNYNDDMTARISSSNWGDICMVPTTVLLPDLGSYFHPLCQLSEIEADYNFATNRQYDGVVYGIPSTGNAQGIIYNKKVAEAAGYTSENLPKTPDEFLTFLQAIKDNTDAIPSVHQLRRRLDHDRLGRLYLRRRYRRPGLEKHHHAPDQGPLCRPGQRHRSLRCVQAAL